MVGTPLRWELRVHREDEGAEGKIRSQVPDRWAGAGWEWRAGMAGRAGMVGRAGMAGRAGMGAGAGPGVGDVRVPT